MNVFVLGGEGFVGCAFVRMAERRHAVTVVTRANYRRARGPACDLLINANGNSRKFLAERDPAREFEASVGSVLRSLLDFPCRTYVYLSTVDVYQRVDDPRRNRETAKIEPARIARYGFHKLLAEQLVRRYAPSWLIVRMGGMVGAGLWKNSIFDLLHGRPLAVHQDSRYQYMNTDDLAAIVLRLLRRRRRNEIINVCGAGTISLREVASLVPGYSLRYRTEKPKRERYEISIAKLRALLEVPDTQTTVRRFIARQTVA